MQVAQKLAAHAHRHLDRSWIAVGDHVDMNHTADRYALKRYRRAILDPRGVFEVAAENDLLGEHPSGRSGHEKNEPDQHGRRRQH